MVVRENAVDVLRVPLATVVVEDALLVQLHCDELGRLAPPGNV